MSAEIVYLGGPYTHADPAVRVERYEALTTAAASLIAAGRNVFSPISMTHPIDVWVDYDLPFMEMCSELAILKIDGWDRSSGVKREIAHFKQRGLPIYLVDETGARLSELSE